MHWGTQGSQPKQNRGPYDGSYVRQNVDVRSFPHSGECGYARQMPVLFLLRS